MIKNRLYRRNIDGELVLALFERGGWQYYIQHANKCWWWRAGNQMWQKSQCRDAVLIGRNFKDAWVLK